jgi:hypothetical protein
MTQIIKFTDTLGIAEEYYPLPASKNIPDWYKNLESYVGGEKKPDGNGASTATAKRCMPIFDAISGGYIISTYTDLFISQKEHESGNTVPNFESSHFNPISFHSNLQLPDHPYVSGYNFGYPKWMNAWSIKTPPGYSCLFISPLHRETPIIILPGIVDTDKYTAPVHFPFVLRDPKMNGLIPAGTPIAQVVLFRREEWEMELGGIEDYKEQSATSTKLKSLFFDSYKKQFRQTKEYR